MKMIATSVSIADAESYGLVPFCATFVATPDVWNVSQDKHIDLMIKALRKLKKEILASPNKDYIGVDKALPRVISGRGEVAGYMYKMERSGE
jgi:hypothetical protein